MTKKEIRKALREYFWNRHYIEIHSGDVEKIIDIIYKLSKKDNPVPSIDDYCILSKEECNILLKELENSKSDEIYYSKLYKKLQNGVETDKEKPKKYIVKYEIYRPDCEEGLDSEIFSKIISLEDGTNEEIESKCIKFHNKEIYSIHKIISINRF